VNWVWHNFVVQKVLV